MGVVSNCSAFPVSTYSKVSSNLLILTKALYGRIPIALKLFSAYKHCQQFSLLTRQDILFNYKSFALTKCPVLQCAVFLLITLVSPNFWGKLDVLGH